MSRQSSRVLAKFETDRVVEDVSAYLRSHLTNTPTVTDGTTPSSQAAGNGAYDVNADVGAITAIADGRVGAIASAVDFAVDVSGTAKLWAAWAKPGASVGFRITITGGANALAATNILAGDEDWTDEHMNMLDLATVFEDKINELTGAGTVTVVATSGKFVINTLDASAVVVAAPTSGDDWTNRLFGGTTDQDAVATTWTGKIPGRIFEAPEDVDGGAFKLTIVTGANALSATDIVLLPADWGLNEDLSPEALAVIIAAKINAAIGAGTVAVTYSITLQAFIINAGGAATSLTVAAPAATYEDWTTRLFGGTSDQDGAPTTWTGATPAARYYDGETIDYAVVTRKASGGGLETIVAESAPYLASAVASLRKYSITRAEVNKEVGSEFWGGVAMVKAQRTGDNTLAMNIDRNFQAYGFYLNRDAAL